jgi:hypothetical protein
MKNEIKNVCWEYYDLSDIQVWTQVMDETTHKIIGSNPQFYISNNIYNQLKKEINNAGLSQSQGNDLTRK